MFKIYGMVHLLPLPGSPLYSGNRDTILRRGLSDADKLVRGGVDGFIVENYGDSPFAIRPPQESIDFMKEIVCMLREKYPEIEIGVNVLRNAGIDALKIAAECKADFIRVNTFIEPVWAPEGLLFPIAHPLLRIRNKVSPSVRIYVDINVKHSKPILSFIDALENARTRGHPDAIIVTGHATGKKTDPLKVFLAKKYVKNIPVIVGSGVTVDNIGSYISIADGIIVGTYLKKDGIIYNPVDEKKVETLVNKAKKLLVRLEKNIHR